MADQELDVNALDDEALEEEVGDVVVLSDEDGNEIEVELLAVIEEEDGNNYAIFYPVDEEDNEVVIMQIVEVEDDEALEAYVPIEDEELLNRIFDEFKEEFEDIFDFEED